jgi:hypothetical protein
MKVEGSPTISKIGGPKLIVLNESIELLWTLIHGSCLDRIQEKMFVNWILRTVL